MYKDISISLNYQFIGCMESYWDDRPLDPASTYEPIGRLGDKINETSLFGINLLYKNLFIDNLSANVKVSNLLDTEVRYPTYTNNSWADKGTLGEQRAFFITVNYNF